jgi:putative sigma-54 modulation protein
METRMNLTIRGHHLEVTPALRAYVMNKLQPVTRSFDQVVDVVVLLTVEKTKEKHLQQRAEITLHLKGRDIFVEKSSADMYAAIDEMMQTLCRVVRDHKHHLKAHHHIPSGRLPEQLFGASA